MNDSQVLGFYILSIISDDTLTSTKRSCGISPSILSSMAYVFCQILFV